MVRKVVKVFSRIFNTELKDAKWKKSWQLGNIMPFKTCKFSWNMVHMNAPFSGVNVLLYYLIREWDPHDCYFLMHLDNTELLSPPKQILLVCRLAAPTDPVIRDVIFLPFCYLWGHIVMCIGIVSKCKKKTSLFPVLKFLNEWLGGGASQWMFKASLKWYKAHLKPTLYVALIFYHLWFHSPIHPSNNCLANNWPFTDFPLAVAFRLKVSNVMELNSEFASGLF